MEGIVIKRNRFKDVLRRKNNLFVPAEYYFICTWRGISSVQGFPCRIKCRLPGVSKTSNVIIIINAIFVHNNAEILFCSTRFYFDGMFSCFPETDNTLIANTRRVQGQKPGSCIAVHGNSRLKQEISFLHGFSFAF